MLLKPWRVKPRITETSMIRKRQGISCSLNSLSFGCYCKVYWGFSGGAMVKNLPATAGNLRDEGLIPGSGKSPGGGHSNPLQYSCLENSMDREALWATIHGVTKNWTQLKQLSIHACDVYSLSLLTQGL